jgi:hypothetical protein
MAQFNDTIDIETGCTFKCCVYNLGSFRWKVILKNIFDVIIAGLYITQFIFGIKYFNKNIVCDTFEYLNIQKWMIAAGIIGCIMMIFRIINFNLNQYMKNYKKTIIVTFWASIIFLLLNIIFILIGTVMLIIKCRTFEFLYIAHIISLEVNCCISSILTLYLINDLTIGTNQHNRLQFSNPY